MVDKITTPPKNLDVIDKINEIIDNMGGTITVDQTYNSSSVNPQSGVAISGAGFLTSTDYASSSTGGIIKTSSTTGTGVSSAGVLYASNSSYATYQSASNYFFISKGTLENVLTGKGYITGITSSDVTTALGYTPCKKITELNPALTQSNGICTWTITNSLSTADVTVQIKDTSTNKHIIHEAISTSSTITIKIVSSSNISAESLKAIITG